MGGSNPSRLGQTPDFGCSSDPLCLTLPGTLPVGPRAEWEGLGGSGAREGGSWVRGRFALLKVFGGEKGFVLVWPVHLK